MMARRLRIFELWSQNLPSKKIYPFIKREYGVSEETFRRDLREMEEWLPRLLQIKGEAQKISAELLGRLRVAQQRLTQLAFTADNSSAQVGAAKGLVYAVMQEVDFRINAGQFTQAPIKVQQEVTGDVRLNWDEVLSRAAAAAARNVLDREARRLRDASPDPAAGSDEGPV